MLPVEFQPYYLDVTTQGDVAIAALSSSEITDDDNIEILGRELFALVDEYECPKIVIDLSGVAYITSSVLGKFITLHRKQSRNEGRLVLCNLESGVANTLHTSRLNTYFTTADDIPAAMNCLE